MLLSSILFLLYEPDFQEKPELWLSGNVRRCERYFISCDMTPKNAKLQPQDIKQQQELCTGLNSHDRDDDDALTK